MHHAAYLSTSRHGIFYFRWPIPAAFHPEGKRTDVKVSLGTRSPGLARQLSKLMISAGQSLSLRASRRSMRYQDIRQHVQDHYRNLLRGFKEDVSAHGPIEGQRLDSLRASKGWAEADPEDFLGIGYPDGVDGLLRKFCGLAGIREELTPPDRKLFVQEIAKAFQTFAAKALDHNTSFDEMELEDQVPGGVYSPVTSPEVHETYEEVVRQYLTEGARADVWAAKTVGEKEDALSLLGEITGGKPLGHMTKADAREVKDVLLRLPRNRRKNPATRDLALRDMLAVKGAQVIAARTLNAYISNMQSFFKWAVNNGHAEVNVFDNTRIRIVSVGRVFGPKSGLN